MGCAGACKEAGSDTVCLTQDEFEELNDWLDLMRRKLKRSVVTEGSDDESESDD
jgi:hypothetical protein